MKEMKPATIRRDFALWLAVLAPALVWLVQFGANYALASWACAHHRHWILPAIAVFSLVPIFAAGAVSGRGLQQRRLPRSGDEPPRELEGRARFMARLGLCLSALFVLVTVAQCLAMWFFPPCAE
jgi:hypothetical protein